MQTTKEATHVRFASAASHDLWTHTFQGQSGQSSHRPGCYHGAGCGAGALRGPASRHQVQARGEQWQRLQLI